MDYFVTTVRFYNQPWFCWLNFGPNSHNVSRQYCWTNILEYVLTALKWYWIIVIRILVMVQLMWCHHVKFNYYVLEEIPVIQMWNLLMHVIIYYLIFGPLSCSRVLRFRVCPSIRNTLFSQSVFRDIVLISFWDISR